MNGNHKIRRRSARRRHGDGCSLSTDTCPAGHNRRPRSAPLCGRPFFLPDRMKLISTITAVKPPNVAGGERLALPQGHKWTASPGDATWSAVVEREGGPLRPESAQHREVRKPPMRLSNVKLEIALHWIY